ncbi:unnamed protein product [Pleuronectes platessa]|uniref:Uncharacterized protein n=1 Tax=Pleuronectes platessa TaxID=8262 RepID=A0A9N7YCN3_PLEPL|nr:unnamed protein product [Pleuronectes platessa]
MTTPQGGWPPQVNKSPDTPKIAAILPAKDFDQGPSGSPRCSSSKGGNFNKRQSIILSQKDEAESRRRRRTTFNPVPRAREIRSIRPSADLRCNHETYRSPA